MSRRINPYRTKAEPEAEPKPIPLFVKEKPWDDRVFHFLTKTYQALAVPTQTLAGLFYLTWE